jgi:hypothetical protein
MRLPQLILIGAFVLLSEVAEATVTMTSPADGSSVTGVVAVNCTDSDPGATFGFYVDNSFQTTSSGGWVMGYVYSKPRFQQSPRSPIHGFSIFSRPEHDASRSVRCHRFPPNSRIDQV